jgi:hypothetical protein
MFLKATVLLVSYIHLPLLASVAEAAGVCLTGLSKLDLPFRLPFTT